MQIFMSMSMTWCRQTFINKKDIATNRSFDEDNVPKRTLRRETFDNKSDTVKTKEKSETMKKYCDQRVDKWATEVRGRMESLSNDLCANDCIYHQQCSINFRTGKGIPKEYAITCNVAKKGRPESDTKKEAFLKTCKCYGKCSSSVIRYNYRRFYIIPKISLFIGNYAQLPGIMHNSQAKW